MITLRNARVAWQRNCFPLVPCPIDDSVGSGKNVRDLPAGDC
ncbi:MAG: hypothetical protein METHP_01179 [Methanoregula sp. SKADARSKE-2]|nr:MAG: hypothetical protein METHP_01179 [Methanoregula sp. SKADARSKE-2]